nr:HipA domain-containing protein [Salinivibrio sp. EAGSL]
MKYESGKAPCIAVYEFFCMTLAKLAGLDVANVELTRIGKTRTLSIERFDRAYIATRDVFQRKHVIDGCQATDLPPGYRRSARLFRYQDGFHNGRNRWCYKKCPEGSGWPYRCSRNR